MIANRCTRRRLNNYSIVVLRSHISLNPEFSQSLCSSNTNLDDCDLVLGVSSILRNGVRIVIDVADGSWA
jgi:hypothetical protein